MNFLNHELKYINKIGVSKSILKNLGFLLILIVISSCSKNDDNHIMEVSNEIAIPDANFEQALMDLGIDTNGLDGTILKTDAEAVLSLDVDEKNIESLQGIEGFKNLTELFCENNELSTLDLSENVLLEKLDCGKNQITNLNISSNIELKFLSCDNNNLSVLDYSSNYKLEDIYFNNNSLTELDFSNNPELINVLADANQITNVNISNNPLLEEFVCQDNSLTSIDFSNNLELKYVYVNRNFLTGLDLSQNTNLKVVYCDFNELTSLNLQNGFNENITNLSITNNEELTCIQVDDTTYSTLLWSDDVDPQINFSTSCN